VRFGWKNSLVQPARKGRKEGRTHGIAGWAAQNRELTPAVDEDEHFKNNSDSLSNVFLNLQAEFCNM